MEVKVPEIQPITLEQWIKPSGELRREELIKPVEESEEGRSARDATSNKVGPGVQAGLLKMSLEETRKLAEEIQKYLSEINISLSFDVDDKTNDIVVKIINRETGKMIRQIPPEELLKLRQKLEELVGVLVNKQV
ncbi:MAG: flagellar protein FlaG [Syntrophobacterales bacterium]|nr:flagellar protein FlaG [Syntrophobacterales bacterium]